MQIQNTIEGWAAGDPKTDSQYKTDSYRFISNPYNEAISFEVDFADSWPKVIDDSSARNEWGWSHKYDLSSTR